ncbi:cupin domain-containing protein [Marinimicrococcus flavescens]|uniref:Cupin domain-containing protein n=1 Tax=Marinimicrococcus flavescens TaxID=3031815 RepID=A0AAP3XPI5_9PROT|nr:cupin domain-containing protein [Marinimicrococcus flavescens]
MSGTGTGPERHLFEDDGTIPNSTLPLLLWRGVLPMGEGDAAAACEAIFASNGWGDAWRWGVYGYHHFHSTAHEVLGVVRGEARIRFGGPNGEILVMHPGDVVLIPAGVGHKDEGSSEDMLVVGAYPDGQKPDMRRGAPGERPEVEENIARLPRWERLPV